MMLLHYSQSSYLESCCSKCHKWRFGYKTQEVRRVYFVLSSSYSCRFPAFFVWNSPGLDLMMQNQTNRFGDPSLFAELAFLGSLLWPVFFLRTDVIWGTDAGTFWKIAAI